MKSKKDEIGSLAVTFREHDHAKCASLLMTAAHNLCIARAVRLTPVREKVLELLLKSHAPLGAYDILAELSASGFRAQPPVAYRALDFLVENGIDCLTWKFLKLPLLNQASIEISKQPNHRIIWLSRIEHELSDNRGFVKKN